MVTSKPSITNCPFTFFQICTGWVYTFSGLLIQKLETENRNILVMNLRFYFSSCHNLIQVVIARGFHLFPFRTEKLSLVTPMVLRNSGRVGSRRFKEAPWFSNESRGFLFWVLCKISVFWFINDTLVYLYFLFYYSFLFSPLYYIVFHNSIIHFKMVGCFPFVILFSSFLLFWKSIAYLLFSFSGIPLALLMANN